MKETVRWSEVKARLADADRDGLLKLVQDLYAASKDNQTFLQARLGLGGDVLRPYKATISRWLWPDVFKNQDTSVAKAKKAITDYKRAVGQQEGLAELMVFYCEQAAGFYADVGTDDAGHFDALVRLFEHALATASKLPAAQQEAFGARLDKVRRVARNIVYGVGEEMDDLLAGHGVACD